MSSMEVTTRATSDVVRAALAAGIGIAGFNDIEEGDIIRSPRFRFARLNHGSDFIDVGLSAPYQCRPTVLSQFQQEDLFRYDATDESRPEALFVVEKVHRHTFYRGHNIGVHVEARRLSADGEFDPAGELIRFTMTGPGASNLIPEVERAGRVTAKAVTVHRAIELF